MARRDFWKSKFVEVLDNNEELAESLEETLYKHYNVNQYEYKCKHLVLNLNPNSYIKNTYLKPKVMNGEITVEQLVEMSHVEINPQVWEGVIKENKEQLEKQVNSMKMRGTCKLFWCPRCKKNDTTYFEKQIRGLDEPMTKFILCIHCGKEWKQ